MPSYFNRFVDWFTMRESKEPAPMTSPSKLMQGLNDVTVLVAEPEGEFANVEAKTVLLENALGPLKEREGLSIRLFPKTLSRPKTGSLSDQVKEIVEQGRKWLAKEQADLLLWGEVLLDEQAVRWYFLSAKEGDADLGIPGKLENLLVPFAPEKASLDVLYAAIFAATVPTHTTQGLKIGEYLLGAVDPLTKLSTGLSTRKTQPAARMSAMGMGAIILANIARRGQELGWFQQAVRAFEQWEAVADKEKYPIDWAFTKNHQGWLYEVMIGHDDDATALEHIDRAIKIFEEVSDIFSRKQQGLEWAAVQLRIAATCSKIGRQLSEPDYLQKSTRYYKKAMGVYTETRFPLNWADCMSRMAKALMLHGQMMKGAQSLEQAGVAFQAVLKVYTEDKYPAQRASTHNNLGATLFALAKRDPHTPQWLDHALMCFEEARAYYQETGKTSMVHVIDKNITKAHDLREQIVEDRANRLID
ncbi:hypothetical protein [Terasakiella pusilla]|uniref:hypothetical protein n=1 Tax=Terasakiella pusilla TaxID=64973 RepID=UPI003AA92A03